MIPQPTLRTERLILRPFVLEDATAVQRLAGAREVADTTLTIPHPYEAGMAEAWIATHKQAWSEQDRLTFAVTTAVEGLVGAIGLHFRPLHQRAELGYWIGRPFWNRGFATEAARAIIQLGFETLGLNRIHASHLTRNPASGRVLLKAGMQFEGILRQHVVRWGRFEDLAEYAILRDAYYAAGSNLKSMSGWTDVAEWDRQRSGADCKVCRSKSDAVAQLETSWVLVGPDDPLRGYACLVFNRHAIELHDLTDVEGAALMRDIRKVSAAVNRIVKPVKMNYEVHGNTVPHLHIHFFPRYRGDQFEGGPINPRIARRPAYGPGEFQQFRARLKHELASRGA